MVLSSKPLQIRLEWPSRLNVQCRNVYEMCPALLPDTEVGSDARDADSGLAGADKAKLSGGTLRQVEHATPDERATIADAHDDAAAVMLVGDPQFGAERQSAVGGGHRRRVHALARCGLRVQRVPGSAA